MDVITAGFRIVAVVIALGGVAKIVSPAGFAGLLGTLGLPASRVLARLSGAVEVAVGVAAVLVGGRAAATAVAVAYAVFAAVVVAARRRGAESCGCFGSTASPPSAVHVVVNSASAAVAATAAIALVPPTLTATLADQPLAGVPYLALVALGAWLTVVVDTTGATLFERTAEVAALGPTFRADGARR